MIRVKTVEGRRLILAADECSLAIDTPHSLAALDIFREIEVSELAKSPHSLAADRRSPIAANALSDALRRDQTLYELF